MELNEPAHGIDAPGGGVSRRTVLRAGAVGAGALLTSAVVGRNLAGARTGGAVTPGGVNAFTDVLKVPPSITLRAGVSQYLTAAPGTATAARGWRFHSSLPAATNTWGYGGSAYLGPTLVAAEDVGVEVVWTNRLGSHPLTSSIDATLMGVQPTDATAPRISTHLHGGINEPQSDGHPDDWVRPGYTKYNWYDNTGEARMMWYHDHALGITRLNVYAGLAGGYVLRDRFDTGSAGNPLGLPTGKYEVPLIMQDKVIDRTTGNQLYPPKPWAPEFFGDQPLVNGTIAPYLGVDAGVYRFRMVNGCNARYLRFRLVTDSTSVAVPPMYVIGGDHGLLNAPVPVSSFIIGPGERYDLLVDFTRLPAGQGVRLVNDAPTPFPGGGSDTTWLGTSTAITDYLRFVGTGSAGQTTRIPSTLRGGRNQPSPLPAVPTSGYQRNAALMEVPTPDGSFMVMLNNVMWDTTAIDAMQVRTTEIWNIANTTVDAHPIHLHLVRFRVIDRQPFDAARYSAARPSTMGVRWNPSPAPYLTGTPQRASAAEAGWKDTAIAYPGQVLRLAVEVQDPYDMGFDPDQTFVHPATGRTLRGFAWHCHLLEHEDHDMMLPLRVWSAPPQGLSTPR